MLRTRLFLWMPAPIAAITIRYAFSSGFRKKSSGGVRIKRCMVEGVFRREVQNPGSSKLKIKPRKFKQSSDEKGWEEDASGDISPQYYRRKTFPPLLRDSPRTSFPLFQGSVSRRVSLKEGRECVCAVARLRLFASLNSRIACMRARPPYAGGRKPTHRKWRNFESPAKEAGN